MRMPGIRTVHKLIKPSKAHACGFCKGQIPIRSFCIKTEDLQYDTGFWHNVVASQSWSHLTCFENDQLSSSPPGDLSPCLKVAGGASGVV
jgi:hypothetical protein